MNSLRVLLDFNNNTLNNIWISRNPSECVSQPPVRGCYKKDLSQANVWLSNSLNLVDCSIEYHFFFSQTSASGRFHSFPLECT